MEVYYVNHKNQKIDLGKSPFQMQIGDIFDYAYKYEGKNCKVARIYKDISTISTTITVDAPDKARFCAAVNRLFEVTEADTIANVQGKLYVGNYYLSCNILSSDKTFWQETFHGMENAVKLLVPYPFWCRDHVQTFTMGASRSAELLKTDPYLYYPITYPYKYSTPKDVGTLRNDHYAACDFKMIIYGPCENPAVHINGHLYEVFVTLRTGEYLLIDSRENLVQRYAIDGRVENIFNARNKESSLFEKMPAGQSTVIWNVAAFGFDVILFQERSEPLWSL